MREINLPVETPQIKINSKVYDVQLSDLEILERAQNAFVKYGGWGNSIHEADESIAAMKELVGLIDEILGEGATKRISGGRPVRMDLAVKWLAAIAAEAADHYAEMVVSDE